ncbi:MAG: hypothetical protein FD170_716 [Bacteroidetes bacterium]|nr:MAG: hypothetical protein FD170_716 [Bacteroidota bacterium]
MRCLNNQLTAANKQDSERSVIPIAIGTKDWTYNLSLVAESKDIF